MRALQLILVGMISAVMGFAVGVTCAVGLRWHEYLPTASVPTSITGPAAKEDLAGLSDVEKVRWQKLRKQVSGFWVFAYHKPDVADGKGRGWKVSQSSPLSGVENGFFSHMPCTPYLGYVSLSRAEAEQHAAVLAEDHDWDVVAIVDFSGQGFPRPAAWFYHDGAAAHKLESPPVPEYGQSLRQFIVRLQ